jgi:hypothetical protein
MGVQLGKVVEDADGVKRHRYSGELTPIPQEPAPPTVVQPVFVNGMRTTNEGRGRMESDYTGVILPLLDEFNPSLVDSCPAPWLLPGKDYASITDGTDR